MESIKSSLSLTESLALESPLSKPRLNLVWQSPVWQFFVIAEDVKYAKCRTCDELISRGGASAKAFNTTNLMNHLKLKHHEKFEKFEEIRKNKETQHQVAKSERIQGKSNQLGGLHQLTLQVTEQRTSVWGINDSRVLCIHKRIGEVIAVDNLPFSLVEDIGFTRLLHTLEPKYNLPS